MAARSLEIRDAIKVELLKIGVTPSSGWESGSGAPQVKNGGPQLDPLPTTLERQIWLQHVGTVPNYDTLGAAGWVYRYEYAVWLLCPGSGGGEDLVSKLERDVRRAIQNATLDTSSLASHGFREGPFETADELRRAGVAGGVVRLFADAFAQRGAP